MSDDISTMTHAEFREYLARAASAAKTTPDDPLPAPRAHLATCGCANCASQFFDRHGLSDAPTSRDFGHRVISAANPSLHGAKTMGAGVVPRKGRGF